MTFEEVLDQALEMLRRRGRVTYRALQRQFGLDDAYLADLKAEIIEAQRLAVDENGTVLVWTGGADSATIPLSAQPGRFASPRPIKQRRPPLHRLHRAPQTPSGGN